jgi:hypothetical protein
MANTPESHDVSSNGPKKLQLKIASRAIGHHRRAILEEAKHYTWWLLAIAIALMVLGTSVSTGFRVRAVIIMIGCVGGAVLALIGFGVIRREAELLDESLEVYDRLGKELELEENADTASGKANKGLGYLLAGLFRCKKHKMETWDWFQVTFLLGAAVYSIGFVGMLVYAILQ